MGERDVFHYENSMWTDYTACGERRVGLNVTGIPAFVNCPGCREVGRLNRRTRPTVRPMLGGETGDTVCASLEVTVDDDGYALVWCGANLVSAVPACTDDPAWRRP